MSRAHRRQSGDSAEKTCELLVHRYLQYACARPNWSQSAATDVTRTFFFGFRSFIGNYRSIGVFNRRCHGGNVYGPRVRVANVDRSRDRRPSVRRAHALRACRRG